MNKLGFSTFSLGRLWTAALVLCFVDFILLTPLVNLPLGALMFWISRAAAGVILLYGPFIVAGIWFAIVAMGLVFHGRRGLALLLTALFVLPATFFHWAVVWNCAVHGQCL